MPFQLGQLQFDPARFDYTTLSDAYLSFDCTAAAASFDATSISDPAVTVVDVQTGVAVDLSNTPSVVSDTIVAYQLDGSQLTAGHSYRIEVTFTAAASTVTLYATCTILF